MPVGGLDLQPDEVGAQHRPDRADRDDRAVGHAGVRTPGTPVWISIWRACSRNSAERRGWAGGSGWTEADELHAELVEVAVAAGVALHLDPQVHERHAHPDHLPLGLRVATLLQHPPQADGELRPVVALVDLDRAGPEHVARHVAHLVVDDREPDAERATTASNVIIAVSGADHLRRPTLGMSTSFSTRPADTPRLVQNVL